MKNWEIKLRQELNNLPEIFIKEYKSGVVLWWRKSDYIEMKVMEQSYLMNLFYDTKNI